jgi:hypothetical protein
MFGYIMPDKPELRIKEYEIFNAFYCGICKSIGKRYGFLPRFTLNYDSTFLAALLWSLTDETLKINRERCIAHPIKKRNIVTKNNVIDYSADINILLFYLKLEDNKRDNNSIVAKSGSMVFKPLYKKIKRKYKEKCDTIEKRLEELFELEKNKCTSMDMAAEPFARIMEEIIIYEPLCKNKNTEKILRWLGYNLGKWIYLVDAFDDMEDDIKNDNYNPLLCKLTSDKINIKEEKVSKLKDEMKDKVEFSLAYSLDQVAKAYELLNVKHVKGLIENIIYLGLYKKTEKILGIGGLGRIESV